VIHGKVKNHRAYSLLYHLWVDNLVRAVGDVHRQLMVARQLSANETKDAYACPSRPPSANRSKKDFRCRARPLQYWELTVVVATIRRCEDLLAGYRQNCRSEINRRCEQRRLQRSFIDWFHIAGQFQPLSCLPSRRCFWRRASEVGNPLKKLNHRPRQLLLRHR